MSTTEVSPILNVSAILNLSVDNFENPAPNENDLWSVSFLHCQLTIGRFVLNSLTLTPFPIEYATKLAIQTV